MNKNRKILLALVKFFLFLALILCFYLQLHQDSFAQMSVLSWNKSRSIALALCLLLLPVNLSVEALKWWYVNRTNQNKISFRASMESILFGACAGLVSPGRWGEPFARAFYLGKTQRQQRIYWNLSSVIAQWVTVLLGGFLALAMLDTPLFYLHSSKLIVFCVIIFLVIVYFTHDIILQKISHLNWFKRIARLDAQQLNLSYKQTFIILFFSMLRFMIFSLQYHILLMAYSNHADGTEVLLKIFLLFLLQSFSVFPGILDIGFKGNIALLLFKNNQLLSNEILFIVFFIWLINLFIPALIGYLLFNKKLKNFRQEF